LMFKFLGGDNQNAAMEGDPDPVQWWAF
jgi:hypothetical protein